MVRLGTMQRAVLESIRDFQDPYASMPKSDDYQKRCRRQTVAFELLRRKWMRLLPHNHPDVINRRCGQWHLTDLGTDILRESEGS